MKHFALVLMIAMRVSAGSVLVTDAFQVGAPDVIGNPMKFDAESVRVTVTGQTLTLDIRTNFDNPHLGSVWEHVRQDIGDVFFKVNGAYAYGIPLHYHNGPAGGPWGDRLLAGHIYEIDDPGALWTARQVLHDPAHYDYRPDEITWMMDNGGVRDVTVGTPTLEVDNIGDGVHGPRYQISVTTSLPPGLFSSPGDTYGLHWAVVTGGTDIVDGALDFGAGVGSEVQAVPEPATWYLAIGALLIGLAKLRWRHRPD